jgi:hypothetical protein
MEVKYVIFCDDVRIENNGKQILIGTYLGNATVNSFPQTLAMMAWVHFIQPDVGQIPFRFLWKFMPSGTLAAEISSTAQISTPSDFSLFVMGPVPILFQNPTLLTLEFAQHDGKPKEVGRIKIEQADLVTVPSS